MSNHTRVGGVLSFVVAVVGAAPAFGAVHLMQIQQVTGAVNGDKNAQAIQLRMRSPGQTFTAGSRIRAFDAAGNNPILIVTIPGNVSNGALGARVLICSPGFAAHTSPAAVCDFTMANVIPASYLAAGSVVFEADGFGILWRLSWGGASYTGTGAGSSTNDGDGNFNPPFTGPLPTNCTRAVLFPGAAGAASSNNAADYMLTAGAATFNNNAGTAFTITACMGDGDCNDSIACTTDACMSGCCVFTPNNPSCPDDGMFCNGSEICNSASGCVHAGNPCTTPPNVFCNEVSDICGICGSNPDCNDGVSCTDDTCMGGTCVFTPNNAHCSSNGLFCDGPEICNATMGCVSSGDPCAVGTLCNETTDACVTTTLTIALEVIAGGSPTAANPTLASPLGITDAGDGTGRLFIQDQSGLIRVIDAGGNLLKDPMLDITGLMPPLGIDFGGGFVYDERGLLGLTFHPEFENSASPGYGKFYVQYSKPRTSTGSEPCDLDNPPGVCHEEVVAQYTMMGDPLTSNVADSGSEVILFRWDKPQWNHNAGHIAFGPDGMLYISTGDGGGAHDGLCDSPPSHGNPPTNGPGGNGQNIESKLGKVIRIDVDGSDGPGGLYGIPPSNPFVGVTGLDEIYAYGFRNPFRFSFDDGLGGDDSLYLADVGQDIYEEIDDVVNGGNYGWAIREGAHCFDPPGSCAPLPGCGGQIDPISEYTHVAGGLAIVGGYVYRGAAYPQLQGKYVYGDFSADFGPTGRLYYFDFTGPDAFVRKEFFLAPSGAPFGQFLKGFGRDADGEIYVAASDDLGPSGTTGVIYKIVPPPPGGIDWDASETSPDRATRSLGFSVNAPALQTASGTPPQVAIKVTMIDLQNPVPPNLPSNPPPNFSTFESATCTAAGEANGCSRWVGKPGTFYESQDDHSLGSYIAARLQCTPDYKLLPPNTTRLYVFGAEIVPSSEYSVQLYGASCKGQETGCANVSVPVTMFTRRFGDVASLFVPPEASGQPNAIDIAQLVNHFKRVSGALGKATVQLAPNLVELNADVNALDIVEGVDAVKEQAYRFSGPCACPSAVPCTPALGSVACPTGAPGPCVTAFGAGATCVKTCTGGDNAGEPCINNSHCPGPGGSCPAGGFCRDRCGRCN